MKVTYQSRYYKHPERIREWLKNGAALPITIEFDPSTKCGHRCPSCVGHTRDIQKNIFTQVQTVVRTEKTSSELHSS